MRSRVSALALALLLSTLAHAYAPQQAGTEMLAPELEARVQKLGKKLRCAVCQGLSITDSPASMARAQLDKVRQLVSEGRSDEEIRTYFVERYGEWVLLEPKAEGLTLLVWILPGVLLLAGGAVVLGQLRRPAAAASASSPISSAGPALSEEDRKYLEKVRAEVER